MKVLRTEIPDVLILEPKVFGDDRGFFFESFNQQKWQEATGLKSTFVQDNHSRSEQGVLRGLHYQLPPRAQGKLVRVVRGEVFDVAVDLRRSSQTFGHWTGVNLSEENKRMAWIPEGFAHGFLVLSKSADFLYKTTEYYAPERERCIHWQDPQLAIDWPLTIEPILSGKDQLGKSLMEAECFV